ncbi:hypothetical protein [Mesorhizobium temperatum]|nr:hypothetical protein [Mesorhizobium temperatum]
MPREIPLINDIIDPQAGLLLDPRWWQIKEIQELFKNGAQPDTRGYPPDFTEGDRRMLRSAAVALKTARTNGHSSDEGQSMQGRRQLVAIISYLTGFVDGKGVGAVNPGLLSIALSTEQPDTIEAKLDALQESLQGVSTRGPGLAVAALGLIVVGIGEVVSLIEDSPK